MYRIIIFAIAITIITFFFARIVTKNDDIVKEENKNKINFTTTMTLESNSEEKLEAFKERIKTLKDEEILDLLQTIPLETKPVYIIYKELERRQYFENKKIDKEKKALEIIDEYFR